VAIFTGFKPRGMQKIANSLGYKGSMEEFDNFLEQNPEKKRQMIVFEDAARRMAEGGYVRMQQGGTPVNTTMPNTTVTPPPPPVVTPNITLPTAPTVEIPPAPTVPEIGTGSPTEIDTGTTTTQPTPQKNLFDEMDKRYEETKKKIDAGEYQIDNRGTVKIDKKFYNSPEYREAAYKYTNPRNMVTQAFVTSPYFGEFPTGGIGVMDQAYEAYAKRMGFDPSSSFTDPRDEATQADPKMATPLPQQPTPVADYGPKLVPVIDENKFLADGTTPNPNFGQQVVDAEGNPVTQEVTPDITEVAASRLSSPGLPSGGQVVGEGVQQSADQFVDPSTGTGQVTGSVAIDTAQAGTTVTELPTVTDANLMQSQTVSEDINTALSATNAAQIDPDDPRSKITAAESTQSSVGDLEAAQGTATLIDNPAQREIQEGELISGVADAEKAAKFAEQIDAATASPSEKATVQGQLKTLTEGFDASNPPPWAAGAIRSVGSILAKRGLSTSSIAGQALVQAALESALPIAQADASVTAEFEAQNLSNRQARAMLAAQQRATFIGQEFDQAFQARVQNAAKISDVANQNFTAEQQVILENSRIANTMNLQNLSNNQALVMAEASALAQLDTANLNNRQQAAVQNAQNFLSMEMTNVSNQQQTELFKAQQRTQALFTDQAAENATRQFNASSQNQVDQFFANLSTQAAQFNATQMNAQAQFNAGQTNVIERFNAELNNQRDQFNAQNRLVIDQSNAQWRRQIATADTATTNRVNELNATNLLNISNTAYNNLWQYFGDTMEWAWTSAENELNRYADMAIANLNADTQADVAKRGSETAAGSAIGSLIGTLGSAYIMSTFCWVAREVYGKGNTEWFVFRLWLKYKAPRWFNNLYKKHGKSYAKFISNKPMFKYITKKLMDLVVKEKGKALKCQHT
jgi:hypothetical protein